MGNGESTAKRISMQRTEDGTVQVERVFLKYYVIGVVLAVK